MSTTTTNFGWILPTPGGDANIWGSPMLGLNNTIINQDALVRMLANTFIGSSAPSVAQSGTMWIDNATNPWVWSIYNLATTTWIEIGTINTTTNTFTPASNSVGTYVGDYKISAQPSNHGIWLLCNGAAISRTTFSGLNALMAALGYPFGAGDGVTTFNIPDLRGAVAGSIGLSGLAASSLPNQPWSQTQTWAIGNYRGEESHLLASSELPDPLTSGAGLASYGGGTNPGIHSTASDGSAIISNGGGNNAHNTMQPTVFAGNYFISFGG